MIRAVVFRVLLFAVPFVFYGIYLYLLRRGVAPRPKTPWTPLFVTGLSLVVISFLIAGLQNDQMHSGVYVPPHAENGHIVPGHFGNGG